MALTVTCGADIVKNYSAGTQSVSLSAVAAGATSYRWELKSVPTGSNALTTTRGSFVRGVATVQNPSFITDAGAQGSYVFWCTASNANEASSTTVDKQSAQQVVTVKTNTNSLEIPNSYQWNWKDQYHTLLTTLEGLVPTSLAALNTKLGVTLDTASDSRAPSGAAGSDLTGTYPNPTVNRIDGIPIQATGATDGHALVYSSANAQMEGADVGSGGTFTGLTDTPANYTDAQYLPVAVNSGETAVEFTTMKALKQNYPHFGVDTTTTNEVSVTARPGWSSTLRVLLSNNKYYTATAPLTMDFDTTGLLGVDAADSPAVGQWHIYAVPSTGSTFSLVASSNASAPTSYATYRYLWSVYWKNGAVSTAVLEPFQQDGHWYYPRDFQSSSYLMAYNDGSYPPNTDSAHRRLIGGTWDGDGGTILGNMALMVPQHAADIVHVRAFAQSAFGGFGGYRFMLSPGQPVSSSATPTGSQFKTVSYNTQSLHASLLYVQDFDDPYTRCCKSLDIPLFEGEMSVFMQTSSSAGSKSNISVRLQGFRNALWGGGV